MSKVTLGGDRLGSGNRQDIEMHNYGRSSHDLSYVWRSSMASGTLVPFMREVLLPGDSYKIDLDCDVKTLPTIGPLFGSYKVQLDVFLIPIRLFVPKLQMDLLNIGNNMVNAKLPQVRLKADALSPNVPLKDIDNFQINASCIFSYLGIRGLGTNTFPSQLIFRDFNAVTWLAYWEIYKNYYANKQEEIGAVIHNPLLANDVTFGETRLQNNSGYIVVPQASIPPQPGTIFTWNDTQFLEIAVTNYEYFDPTTISLWIDGTPKNVLGQLFSDWTYNTADGKILFFNQVYNQNGQGMEVLIGSWFINNSWLGLSNSTPRISTFPLENIDNMRLDLMTNVTSDTAYRIENTTTFPPYSLALHSQDLQASLTQYSIQSTQEGLALKTYQSDLFNNWVSTEWIDGDNGVNAITAIDTTSGSITIDEINMQSKIYNMLNRIALSGGSYDDWLNAVYTHERVNAPNNPIYIGGLSKELAFQEVISTAEANAESQPLGTLAGRGVLTNKQKGGYITVNASEPSYVMGIVSLTPRIDYSQGNKWDVNLKTLDDFHKPALDEIGFQDLITDQMAWWDTIIDPAQGNITFKSAGKQPAWINYMTNVNEIRGTFAEQSSQMFMVLNRRYEAEWEGDETNNTTIKDLTTYIDPSKFNNIFADTRLDAQNFWVQIKTDIFARRKMSAKVIPNL